MRHPLREHDARDTSCCERMCLVMPLASLDEDVLRRHESWVGWAVPGVGCQWVVVGCCVCIVFSSCLGCVCVYVGRFTKLGCLIYMEMS